LEFETRKKKMSLIRRNMDEHSTHPLIVPCSFQATKSTTKAPGFTAFSE
jgi:hypothetical protein